MKASRNSFRTPMRFKCLAGVVAVELPRLGDATGGAHDASAGDSSGTQTAIAPGSTSMRMRRIMSRAPPSIS